MKYSEWEDWLIETGDDVIRRKAAIGWRDLNDPEEPTYRLWVLDYGMRNAGDLQTTKDLFPDFQKEGAESASHLGLKNVAAIFQAAQSLSQQRYLDELKQMCSSVSGALNASKSRGGLVSGVFKKILIANRGEIACRESSRPPQPPCAPHRRTSPQPGTSQRLPGC